MLSSSQQYVVLLLMLCCDQLSVFHMVLFLCSNMIQLSIFVLLLCIMYYVYFAIDEFQVGLQNVLYMPSNVLCINFTLLWRCSKLGFRICHYSPPMYFLFSVHAHIYIHGTPYFHGCFRSLPTNKITPINITLFTVGCPPR